MNATEEDLTSLLHEIAGAAPERSSFVIPSGRARRRPFLPLLAAAVVIALIAGLTAIATLRGGSDTVAPAAAPATRHVSIYDGKQWTSDPPRSTFTPSPRQRQQLLTLARRSARMNGERHPQVSVAGTTIARLCARYPGPFCTGTAARTARDYGLPSPTARVWFIWMRGQFGTAPEAPEAHPLLGDLVDARTMRDLVGSFDLDTGYGVNPELMAPLGVVVRLA